MWFVKGGINILAYYELSNNIMEISVELCNGKSLQISGVWLKFGDNSSESLENFQINLLILESEIKNNVEKKQLFDFVNNKDLIISDELDSVGFTYRNRDYKALIEHIVWGKNESDFKMVKLKICNGNNNSTDHLPITIKVDVDLGVKEESNQVIWKFHRFDWNFSGFIEKYNENLEKMMPEIENYFTKEQNVELINQFYKELCGTSIQFKESIQS
ncbi:unnamed protein product [Brachionus calyciflorus]|uniref:Uncharacterized protein n=1 Tax=Brachionus calyciflorus TaxID=104777 RepID=A0A813LZ43_9BILA|nr:unnamed protein product [Brachionus calyciflorus]